MDNWLALVLTVALVLRVFPYVLVRLSPRIRRRLETRVARFQALIDVAIGTLMACLVGFLLWRGEWIWALLLGAISFPTWKGMWQGLVVLARTE